MVKYSLQIPRWYSLIFLIISTVIGLFWIRAIGGFGGSMFTFMGSLIILMIIATAVYMLVTGKSVWSLRKE